MKNYIKYIVKCGIFEVKMGWQCKHSFGEMACVYWICYLW